VVSGQWSVVSGQWSVVSGQWSVVSAEGASGIMQGWNNGNGKTNGKRFFPRIPLLQHSSIPVFQFLNPPSRVRYGGQAPTTVNAHTPSTVRPEADAAVAS
jgi:hypothetical protein